MNGTWQDAENEADMVREWTRPARHLARMTALEKRERRAWPTIWAITLTAALTLAAAIQGGALHV